MKKLIVLVLCVAMVLSLPIFASADAKVVAEGFPQTASYGDVKMITYMYTDLSFRTEVIGVGPQATLLIHKGDTLDTSGATNIQAIDQEPSTSTITDPDTELPVANAAVFEYSLKDNFSETLNVDADYTFKIGGSTYTPDPEHPITMNVVPNPKAEDEDPETTAIIDGVIDGVATEDSFDTFMVGLVMGNDEEAANRKTILDDKWLTKVELLSFDDYIPAAKNLLLGESNPVTVLAYDYAEIGTGIYNLEVDTTEVEPGDYILRVSRYGHTTQYKKFAFAGEDITIDDIELLPGDAYVDGFVDGPDAQELINNFDVAGYAGEDAYMEYGYKLDINSDGFVDGVDTAMIYSSFAVDIDETYYAPYEMPYLFIALGMY